MSGEGIKIHQALVKPVVLLGAPRPVTIINMILSLNMVMVFRAWWVILFSFVVQAIGVYMVKDDPDFVTVSSRHLKHVDYYHI